MSTAADLISATPGYSGFEQVRDGVFVGRGTQKDLVVLLDVDAGARGGSGCGGLSSGAHAERRRESAQIRDWWFLRALLDAVDRLPALRDATQLNAFSSISGLQRHATIARLATRPPCPS
jgi:hypothetical protein